jgi:thiamine biosynthesis lipoprotein
VRHGAVAWFVVLACAGGARAQVAAAETLFSESRPAMGTTFDVHLYAADRARADALFEVAFEEIERVEAVFSNYRPTSELSRINREAASSPVVTDPEVFDLLARAFAVSRLSGGAFDMTVGRLMKAWGFFRGAGRYPSDAELKRALRETGWRRVRLDAAARTTSFTAPGVELDPGGIGKGYALDCVAKVLREAGVAAALLSSGSSSVYALGAPPGKEGWPVRVPDPLNRARVLSTVVLRDRSLSTSGNYEKFFRLGGRTYSHIMNPRTGRPVEGVLQTTVIAAEATDSDALSTAVFVLGPARAAALLKNFEGAAALVVTDRKGAGRVVEINWPRLKDAKAFDPGASELIIRPPTNHQTEEGSNR